MTVLHDDGLYRHLRFKRPRQSFYWFDIVTWPGCLTIRGDMGCWTFAREEDMFGFFAGSQYKGPNLGYWAEKVQGGTPTKEYSRERALKFIDDMLSEEPGVTTGHRAMVRAELDEDLDDVAGFESTIREWMVAFRHDGRQVFADAWWEADLSDWIYQFEWCCHAILYAISAYRLDKTVAAAVAE